MNLDSCLVHDGDCGDDGYTQKIHALDGKSL